MAGGHIIIEATEKVNYTGSERRKEGKEVTIVRPSTAVGAFQAECVMI